MRSSILTQKRAKSLRRSMTAPEQLLWALLRRDSQNLHFRRQHALGPYILDFFCAKAKLCVEVDGPLHLERHPQDARRDAWLAAEGIQTLRVPVAELEQRPQAVLNRITAAAAGAGEKSQPLPHQYIDVR